MSIRMHQYRVSTVVEEAESGTVFSMAPKTMLENGATKSPISPMAIRKQLTKVESSSFTNYLQENTVESALISWSYVPSFSCHVTQFNSWTSVFNKYYLNHRLK